ncbi:MULTISPECIES: helix-turn-helix transcriptional regulator [unclassified Arthrobacter]|uniref:helix-turn-helix transcriptional regulator n=1 Tax=unclassified Arthrobacter TaxID=235627 RepID=UPI001491CF6B|nr:MULTISPECIES: LuxR family transcriptional regulator [unclassified Arthrobacter]MBE0009057.1 helix-turn-helix transcriptional regulator [Arthrobacter sp. AET 35A]NOJ62813.1 AAA family ATPase [Arthrobacter sp. 147(2020)]
MFGVKGAWPLVGRDDEIKILREAIDSQDYLGAVLTGLPGIGKTVLAQQVARDVEARFELLYIRGSLLTADMPYGALNFVLSELDDEAVDNPLILLRSLQKLFAGRSDGKRTLVLADNIEDLDSASAMAIAHLVRTGAVKVLLVAQALHTSPNELSDLWKDQLIRRVDIEPLSLADSAELLTLGLKGPVSRSVVLDTWHASGGNPLFLQAIGREQVESGYITTQDGIWVAGPRRAPDPGRIITERISARLARLSPDQRRTAEIVAIVGVMPLELLADFAGGNEVDALMETGILEIELTQQPMVRVATGLIGEVIRHQVSVGRSRELVHQLASASLRLPMPALSRMNYAAWCLDGSLEIDPGLAIEAAQLANRYFDTEAALRFLSSIPAEKVGAPEVTEEARAYGVQGDTARALQTLDDFISSDPQNVDLHDWVFMQVLRCRLLSRDHARFMEADTLLAEIRERLFQAGRAECNAFDGLFAEVELLDAELNAHNGRYAAMIEPINELLKRSDSIDPAARHQLCGWLAEALSMTGRQEDAVQLSRLVMSRLADSIEDPLLVEAAQVRLFSVMLISGQWELCLAMISDHQEGMLAGIFDGTSLELAEGCLFAYAGRGTEALTKLLPALSQLRIRDRHEFLSLAEAATAYAYTLTGDAQLSLSHLDQVDLHSRRYDWHTARATKYFAVLASTATRDNPEAAREMLQLADEDRAKGNYGHELFFLCQAVQLGQSDVAERLATSGMDSQGAFAETCALFGKGVASGDTAQILQAAKIAADVGNQKLAVDAANLVQRLSAGSTGEGARSAAAEAGNILRSIGRGNGALKQRALDLLTERERSIARLVTNGMSNREIATMLTLSIRTVEGHMYQVYAKLGVANRSQLKLILD